MLAVIEDIHCSRRSRAIPTCILPLTIVCLMCSIITEIDSDTTYATVIESVIYSTIVSSGLIVLLHFLKG